MAWPTTTVSAELGDTQDPTALVPGDPAGIEETTQALDKFSIALRSAGDRLRRIDAGGWTGIAADRFHARFQTEPDRWINSGHAFGAAADALRDYTHTLTWAQAQATEAIALWDQAQTETKQARAEHAAAVRQAHEQAMMGSLAGVITAPVQIPFVDPGQATRAAARDLLDRARAQLAEAGDRAEGVVADGRDQAPPEPAWWQKPWRLLREYQTGVYEATIGMGQFVWSVSTVRMLIDPVGYTQAVTTLAQSAQYAVHHPVEFAKAAVDWETWQTNPARALGRLAPDLAVTIATAGGGGAAVRGARAASALSRLPRPAPSPARHPDAGVAPAWRAPTPPADSPLVHGPVDGRDFGPAGTAADAGRWIDERYADPPPRVEPEPAPPGPWWYPDFDEPDPPAQPAEPEPAPRGHPDPGGTPEVADRADTAHDLDTGGDAEAPDEGDTTPGGASGEVGQPARDEPDPDTRPAGDGADRPPTSWLEPSTTPGTPARAPGNPPTPAGRATAGPRVWGELSELPVVDDGVVG